MPGSIWVVIELEEGAPARSSLEVLGKAAQLGRAEAIVLGSAAAQVASTLGEFGAEKVYVHEDAAYDNYLTLPAVDTVSDLLKQHQPVLLMLATTYELRDIAARLNVRNNIGLITDATDLRFEAIHCRSPSPGVARMSLPLHIHSRVQALCSHVPRPLGSNNSPAEPPRSRRLLLRSTPTHRRSRFLIASSCPAKARPWKTPA